MNSMPSGVGFFHNIFFPPPSFSKNLSPNPKSHSNPREKKEFFNIRGCIPSLLLMSSPLAYNLTTFSRGFYSPPLSSLEKIPAENIKYRRIKCPN